MIGGDPSDAGWERVSTERGADITAAEQTMLRELRAATPATGESRAALKQSVCDYVRACLSAGLASEVVLGMVRQLVIGCLDLNTNNVRDPRNEAYTFVSQIAELCVKEHYSGN